MNIQKTFKMAHQSESPMQMILRSVWLLAVLTLLLGVMYPLVVTGLAQTFFPHQANGSMVQRNGKTVGSALIGQDFTGTVYFQSRPSMTPGVPYNAQASAGSNFSVGNPKQILAIGQRAQKWFDEAPNQVIIPTDLLTASASGLDPHITLEAAYYQMQIVSEQTGLSQEELKKLIDEHSEHTIFGTSAHVNVLLLNLSVQNALKAKAQSMNELKVGE